MKDHGVANIVERFCEKRILVVGDVMLDRFIWGRVTRVSPEAPVPVVEVVRESAFPGGAANVARNIRALGGAAEVLGVTGRDEDGRTLCDILHAADIAIRGMVVDRSRHTTLKTRIIAGHQQVVRMDRECVTPIAQPIAKQLLRRFCARIGKVDAVIFTDYAKGVLSQSLLDQMRHYGYRYGKIMTADPNARQSLNYAGLTTVKPNRHEALFLAGISDVGPASNPLMDKSLLLAGEKLMKRWNPRSLLVSLGEQGLCLFQPGQKPHHIPTMAREVCDVSGAGDTVIAALTLALASGALPETAATLANAAAGVVVEKIGTATCSTSELLEKLE